MFQLKYKNAAGDIIFCGDGKGLINVMNLEGFGLPTKDYKTIEFAAENGSTLIGERDMARTMTISATVRDQDGDQRERINRVLHGKGELYCIFDNLRRKIECRVTVPPAFSRVGKSNLYTFAIQLLADYPYFSDFENAIIPIYRTNNLVTEVFTLPCVFTERISRTNVQNRGDKFVYPIITIKNMGESSGATGSICIDNYSTGARITINYIPTDGEIITVDTSTRRITSDNSNDITRYISDDTDLSAFYFCTGTNDVAFTNTAQGQVLSAVANFSPEYFSAEV